MTSVSATKLKITTVLKADEVLAIPAPDGKLRVILRVKFPDRVLSADIAAKVLRRVQTAIRETGAENVALVLQGSLVAGDVVAEAGLSAQPKNPKKATVKVEPQPVEVPRRLGLQDLKAAAVTRKATPKSNQNCF